MNLRLADLARHLAGKLAPVYVLHGDEPLLQIEAGDALRAAARRAGFDDRKVLVVESGFDWNEFTESHQNLSLFGGRSVIDLRLPTGKPGVEGAKRIEAYADQPSPDNLLIVSMPRVDKATQSSKWFSALEDCGVTIATAPIEREALPPWIAARLAVNGQRAGTEVLQMLAERCEGNLLAAQQEIAKLALLLPAGEVSLQAVEDAVARVARYDAAELSEAMLCGDAKRFCRVLAALEIEGESPPLIVWQLSEDLHALCSVLAATRSGLPIGQAVKQARVWGRRQAAMEKAARRVDAAKLGPLLTDAARLDALAKGIGKGDVWLALRNFGLAIAGADKALLHAL